MSRPSSLPAHLALLAPSADPIWQRICPSILGGTQTMPQTLEAAPQMWWPTTNTVEAYMGIQMRQLQPTATQST